MLWRLLLVFSSSVTVPLPVCLYVFPLLSPTNSLSLSLSLSSLSRFFLQLFICHDVFSLSFLPLSLCLSICLTPLSLALIFITILSSVIHMLWRLFFLMTSCLCFFFVHNRLSLYFPLITISSIYGSPPFSHTHTHIHPHTPTYTHSISNYLPLSLPSRH